MKVRTASVGTVLVVDDDEAFRLLSREALEQEGFAVAEAADGHEALARLAEGPVDLVLLDVIMPRLDGFATLEQIRATPDGAELPVIMLTGIQDIDSIHRAYESGATDFLTKPTNWRILCQRVRYALRASRAAEELRRAREQALEIARLRSELVGNLSHEILTPLNGVTGMAQLLLDTSLDEGQRECVDSIVTSAQSLLRIASDILDVARMDSGRFALAEGPLDLREVLSAVQRTFGPGLERRGIGFGLSCDDHVPVRLLGDRLRLLKLLSILVDNAQRFTEEGEVKLEVSSSDADGDHVDLSLRVADTGIGIPADKQPLIFELFSQVDGSTTRSRDGLGLGLPLAARLARLMGGSIGVESAPGVGSAFTLTVRLRRAAQPKRGASGAGDEAAAHLRVLLAEDHPVNRRLVERLLERRGHRVHAVVNGREAVEAVRQGGEFDLVLMDIQMPEMDGFAATRAIRALSAPAAARLPIIALTAYAVDGFEQRCTSAGMNAFATKPVDTRHLFDLIDAEVSRARRTTLQPA
jgi:CheY-like chemotaxis protein